MQIIVTSGRWGRNGHVGNEGVNVTELIHSSKAGCVFFITVTVE